MTRRQQVRHRLARIRQRVARRRLRFRAWWAHYGTRVSVVLLCASTALSVTTLVRTEVIDCATRHRSRTEVRAAIEAAVDEVAVYVDAPPHERAEVRRRVAVRVRQEFPPPHC